MTNAVASNFYQGLLIQGAKGLRNVARKDPAAVPDMVAALAARVLDMTEPPVRYVPPTVDEVIHHPLRGGLPLTSLEIAAETGFTPRMIGHRCQARFREGNLAKIPGRQWAEGQKAGGPQWQLAETREAAA